MTATITETTIRQQSLCSAIEALLKNSLSFSENTKRQTAWRPDIAKDAVKEAEELARLARVVVREAKNWCEAAEEVKRQIDLRKEPRNKRRVSGHKLVHSKQGWSCLCGAKFGAGKVRAAYSTHLDNAWGH